MTSMLCLILFLVAVSGQNIPDQDWGYIDVRTGAHMFWWLYGANSSTGTSRQTLPLIIWLQGGPGASSTGYGNFEEMGPLDVNLNPRNTTWVSAANILYIDQPVGSGYSYVDAPQYYTTNNDQISNDLVAFLQQFLVKYPIFQDLPLWIFCESYGGKMTTGFANALLKAIDAKQITLNKFSGVALGNSWISGIDYVDAWGPFLMSNSLLDQNQAGKLKTLTSKCDQYVANGEWNAATNCWGLVESEIELYTDGVDFYNFLLHNVPDDLLQSKKTFENPIERMAYLHTRRNHLLGDSLDNLMNGPIKQQLGIPANVTWGGQSNNVFNYLSTDFMKPVIDGVDNLLKDGRLTVVVYSGQLDLICCTTGTLNWMGKLTWSGMQNFYTAAKTPLYAHGDHTTTDGFVKTSGKLSFYWIMNAGHMVPADNGNMALEMVHRIIGV